MVFSFDASSSRKAFCNSLQPLRRETPPLQPDFVDPEGLVLAPRRGERKRQYILGHDRSAAHKRIGADRAMLVHRAKCAQRHVVLDHHVPGQRGGSWPECSGCPPGCRGRCARRPSAGNSSRPGYAAAARGAAADGHALADRIVVADLGFGRLARVLQVLRRHTDGAERIEDVARADRVRPSSTTCETSVQSSPSTTSGPMVQNGPTVQESGTTAPGAMTALG